VNFEGRDAVIYGYSDEIFDEGIFGHAACLLRKGIERMSMLLGESVAAP
jgi:hypothetical protein